MLAAEPRSPLHRSRMNGLYWFATVVGVGMYLFSVAADLTGGDHGDLHDAAGTDPGHHDGDTFRLLSLRTATYGLFAFGVSGVLLTWLWKGAHGLLIGGLAATLGIVGAAISVLAFGWLRRSESGALPGEETWIGATAEIILPILPSGTGKIQAVRAGRTLELLARPFDASAEHPEQWTQVMVIDVRDGVALVAPGESMLTDPEPEQSRRQGHGETPSVTRQDFNPEA